MAVARGLHRAAVYVFDTSAFIAAWSETYPPDIFAPFWMKLDDLAQGGRLIAPREVLNELGKKDDDARSG